MTEKDIIFQFGVHLSRREQERTFLLFLVTEDLQQIRDQVVVLQSRILDDFRITSLVDLDLSKTGEVRHLPVAGQEEIDDNGRHG